MPLTNVFGDTNPPHTPGTEAGARNFERALALTDPNGPLPYCDTCNEKRFLIHMTGDGWAVAHHHEPHCEHHDDKAEAYEVHVGQGYDAEAHATAEGVWQATLDNEAT
jgi:hypothetical protein